MSYAPSSKWKLGTANFIKKKSQIITYSVSCIGSGSLLSSEVCSLFRGVCKKNIICAKLWTRDGPERDIAKAPLAEFDG